jgi:hypothetical protein
MVNSHIAEALAHTALRFDDAGLRSKAADFMTRFIHMLFDDGDPTRPTCFEHYNPFTGKASRYRGVDDYQHSWIVELIIKYAAGIRPRDADIVIDPFPFDLENLHIEGVTVRGRRVGVHRLKNRFTVSLDGVEAATSPIGTPVCLSM